MNDKNMDEHEYKNVAIIGAGASGCICAYHLSKEGIKATVFDRNLPLLTLLPTGGGRCNLAHNEYDFKELAKNYPRGEKFLYSVFSQFSTRDTIALFKDMGVDTYVQDDGRIFPQKNSSKFVREQILKNIKEVDFVKETVLNILPLNNNYKIKTNKSEYLFTHVVLAMGGHFDCSLLKHFNINIIPPRPSLVGLSTKEDFRNLNGIVLPECNYDKLQGNVVFTNFGISGPLIYKISSLKAFDEFPYTITLDLCKNLSDLQHELNTHPHKNIKNVIAKFVPLKMAEFILKKLNLNTDTQACFINGHTRDAILTKIHEFKLTISGTNKGEETVTAGGIDLNEINPKTLEVKTQKNFYVIGEMLNIDGFCGGFNLQNAWSTAFIAANSILLPNH